MAPQSFSILLEYRPPGRCSCTSAHEADYKAGSARAYYIKAAMKSALSDCWPQPLSGGQLEGPGAIIITASRVLYMMYSM